MYVMNCSTLSVEESTLSPLNYDTTCHIVSLFCVLISRFAHWFTFLSLNQFYTFKITKYYTGLWIFPLFFPLPIFLSFRFSWHLLTIYSFIIFPNQLVQIPKNAYWGYDCNYIIYKVILGEWTSLWYWVFPLWKQCISQ